MKKTLIVLIIVISGLVISALLFGAGMMFDWTTGWRIQDIPQYGYGMMGRGGYGMMDENWNENFSDAQPITIEQAKQAVEDYLAASFNPEFEIAEIMIFNNNGYAIVVEKSTGIGAMELLINPIDLTVFPEYGPNMMWNLKYGMMGSGGMMGNRNYTSDSASATMTISAEQAGKIAQDYLDKRFPGTTVSSEPDAFYGYYTLDTLKNGEPTGMLSINGFNGQVFLHTWHGTFIEMFE